MRVTLIAFLILALAGVAQAVVTVAAVEVTINAAAQDPNGTFPGDPNLMPNTKCWDIQVTSDRDLIGVKIVSVEDFPAGSLYNGGIYNHGLLGTDDPPNSALFTAYPALEFDSYVDMPDGATIIGGSGPLGSEPNDLPIDYGDFVDDGGQTNFVVARITLLSGGEGKATMTIQELDPNGDPDERTYIVYMPEPATMSLLALGGLVALRRRR